MKNSYKVRYHILRIILKILLFPNYQTWFICVKETWEIQSKTKKAFTTIYSSAIHVNLIYIIHFKITVVTFTFFSRKKRQRLRLNVFENQFLKIDDYDSRLYVWKREKISFSNLGKYIIHQFLSQNGSMI